jgi:hypothetical protein
MSRQLCHRTYEARFFDAEGADAVNCSECKPYKYMEKEVQEAKEQCPKCPKNVCIESVFGVAV